MQILNDLVPGSDEWLAERAERWCASEAPAMKGASSKMKRNELLHNKKTMNAKEFSDWVQRNILDKGHEAEAAARPIIEAQLGEDLFPAVAVDDSGRFLASFDGITMMEDTVWEHKLFNQELAAQVAAQSLEPEYYWQLEHQLLVSGAEKVIFTVSDGTEKNMVSMEYRPVKGRREQLIRGWEQFERDLAEYVPVEEAAPIVGEPVTDLPAVLVQVKGSIDIIDNFKVFETALRDFLDNKLIREPQTDEDFVNLDLQIKALERAEDALQSAEAHMLAQVSSIDSAKRTKDMLNELVRSNRLASQKLFKAEKENRRNKILQGGQTAWKAHIDNINKTLGGKIIMPAVPIDFAGAMKGKRTISSLQDAVDTELARAKIAANEIADKIRLNRTTLQEEAKGYEGLFADAQQLVMKENEDLLNVIKLRISEHKAAEQKRIDDEREKIRQEEQERADREAREKLEQEAAQRKAHEDAMQKKLEQFSQQFFVTPSHTSADIQAMIDECSSIPIDDSFCDKKAEAALEKEKALSILRDLKQKREQAENEHRQAATAPEKAEPNGQRPAPLPVNAKPAVASAALATPAPSEAANTKPRAWKTLRDDLNEWREANDIDDHAFNILLAILERHQALRETAA